MKERVLDHLYFLIHSDAVRCNEIAYQIVLVAIRRVEKEKET